MIAQPVSSSGSPGHKKKSKKDDDSDSSDDEKKKKTGMERLEKLGGVLVKQKADEMEDATGIEKENKYKVYSMKGKKLFEAKEKSDMFMRQCCGPSRSFDMKVEDEKDDEKKVMELHRPLNCQSCWFPCCLQELEVEIEGTLAGKVVQQWNPIRPVFMIEDAVGGEILRIEGPICTWDCCCEVRFNLYRADDEDEVKIGEISKKWTGLGEEMFTDADNFGVSFPKDLDIKVKLSLLAATFLIDFMYFEESPESID